MLLIMTKCRCLDQQAKTNGDQDAEHGSQLLRKSIVYFSYYCNCFTFDTVWHQQLYPACKNIALANSKGFFMDQWLIQIKLENGY